MPQELAFLPIQVSWPLSHGCDDVSLTYFVNSFPISGHPPEALGQQCLLLMNCHKTWSS